MSDTYENSSLTHGQKTYLDKQKQFGLLFGIFTAIFFLFNITSGVSANVLNLILGVIVYRGLNRRFAATTILGHPDLSNKQLLIKTLWAFTWRTFLAFFAVPAIFLTFIEPDTRQGQALGLFIGYFVITYALSADRGFWLIRKVRTIPNEPVKIDSVTGLSSNQKIIRNALIVLLVLFGIFLSGSFINKPKAPENTNPKPLPPTRTEEMQQRVESNAKRSGDSRFQEVFEKNKELYRSVEQAAGKLISACEKINGDVIFEPHKSNPEKVSHEIQILAEMKQSAIKVNEELSVFEETTKQEISKKFSDSPETVRSAMDKAQEGKVLFKKWTHDAIQFTKACTLHLEFFQATGKIDQALELAAAQSAVKFEETAKKLDERIQSNFNKMEATMPR